jgi:hypothetical protein
MNFFVQDRQAKLRYKNQQILVENYLQNQNCQYWFTSTQQQESFCKIHKDSHRRGKEVQPHPIMHYYFIVDCVKPALNLPIHPELQELVEKIINQTEWIAYDPDRKEIWENICNEIDFKYSSIINNKMVLAQKCKRKHEAYWKN